MANVEEEYHVPVFGSQMQQADNQPQPFKLNQQESDQAQQMTGTKRTYEQAQADQNQVDENGLPYKTIEDFANLTRMQAYKEQISKSHKNHSRAKMQQR